MKLTSSSKIAKGYNIDDLVDGRCKITFIDLSSEVIETHEVEGGTITEYIYDAYPLSLVFNEEEISQNYSAFLLEAKTREYNRLADEVREKRNQLLTESDKYMALDRLDLDTSTAIKFLASLKNIFNNDYAKYRQALRDITKQENFPYDVTFPTKPE
ncbi:MAG: phage tail assembly chaperone [Bacillus sp. (in: Bacteria)]|nr:phage tail assembly chaperone [Bacillus sp. (in: firmicutes)]